ncbi:MULTISPECIES: nucleoside 2-deoxyribosyltransferase [unclassified Exiguobacterium]|uniref:nucleoside 2-deoxyribosyltransferase n=1 Tax=unclassified Exiguobacterium TaxID=2644629 RepID=UPI001BEBF0C4|nr:MULTISPECIES: nucleoside 2-deoxyribosyltransferase [unclassified Exiguobacterium]
MKTYLAAGFFNERQLADVKAVEAILEENGMDYFSPRQHQFEELEFGSLEWRYATFDNDVEHIREADVMVAIIDEAYDSGTVWEIGYAYSIGVPIILVDVTGSNKANLMLTESVTAYLHGLAELSLYDFSKRHAVQFEGEVI